MDDTTKMIVKVAVVGVAAYLGYRYLQSSGLWAKWFGASNSFSDPNLLLSYCQANPTLTATFTGGSAPITQPCQNWINAVSTPSPVPVVPPSQTPVVNPPALSDIQAKVVAAAGGPGVTLNADGWNYYWGLVTGVPQTADLFPAGNRDALMTFAAYLAARASQGLTGRLPMRLASPYPWIM